MPEPSTRSARWQVVVMPAKGHGDRRWTIGFRWKWEASRFARDLRRIGAREAIVQRGSRDGSLLMPLAGCAFALLTGGVALVAGANGLAVPLITGANTVTLGVIIAQARRDRGR